MMEITLKNSGLMAGATLARVVTTASALATVGLATASGLRYYSYYKCDGTMLAATALSAFVAYEGNRIANMALDAAQPNPLKARDLAQMGKVATGTLAALTATIAFATFCQIASTLKTRKQLSPKGESFQLTFVADSGRFTGGPT